MNPLQNHDLLSLVIKYLDLNSCLRLLRVNKFLLKEIGLSSVWDRFVKVLNKSYEAKSYYQLCMELSQNNLVPSPICERIEYGENYYRFVFQTFDFRGEINILGLLHANFEDITKTKLLFKQIYAHRIGEPVVLKEFNSLMRIRGALNQQLQEFPPKILAKFLVNPACPLSAFGIKWGLKRLIFQTHQSIKHGLLPLTIYTTFHPDWHIAIPGSKIAKEIPFQPPKNMDFDFASIAQILGIVPEIFIEIIYKIAWFIADIRSYNF